jgi:hypothetical protein
MLPQMGGVACSWSDRRGAEAEEGSSDRASSGEHPSSESTHAEAIRLALRAIQPAFCNAMMSMIQIKM